MRRFVLRFSGSAFLGFCALVAVNTVGANLGLAAVGVTPAAVAVTGLLGIPGISLVLILNSLCA